MPQIITKPIDNVKIVSLCGASAEGKKIRLKGTCDTAAKENSTARLRSFEITSPLCKRDDYTLGDSMAFLRLWFLQKNPDATVVPEFIRDEHGQFYLEFIDKELWIPSGLEKEISTRILA